MSFHIHFNMRLKFQINKKIEFIETISKRNKNDNKKQIFSFSFLLLLLLLCEQYSIKHLF
jgi:hypothetical protein